MADDPTKVLERQLALQKQVTEQLLQDKKLSKGRAKDAQQIVDLLRAGAELEDEIVQKKLAGSKLDQKTIEALQASVQAEEDKSTAIEDQNKSLAEQEKRVEKIKEIYGDIYGLVQDITGVNFQDLTSLKGLASTVVGIAQSFDAAQVSLAKTSGYTRALSGDMKTLAMNNDSLGIGIAESSEIVGSLASNMTLFAASSGYARAELAQTTALLSAMGVDAATTGQALDALTRGMGLSTSSASNAAIEFDRLGQSLGLPASQLIGDFNALSGSLAKYGKLGTKQFKELAKEARKMGMGVQEAFAMADLFDTFEGAADIAGRLNAQIGLRLNSVELMAASEADRIKILRNEFQMRGKNFDDMDRREKQAIARAMGVDVDMARRMFGDPVALRKYQREQKGIDERAESMTTAMQKFKVAIENVVIGLGPLIENTTDFIRIIAESGVIKVIAMGVAFFAVVKSIAAFVGAVKLLAVPFTLIAGLFAATDKAAGSAGAGVARAGASAGVAAPGFGKLGVALLPIAASLALVGVGIAAAGFGFKMLGEGITMVLSGFSTFISQLAELAPEKIYAVSVGVLALASAMVALAAASSVLGNPLALIGLTALTLAIATIGDSLAGDISEASEGLANMGKVIELTTKIKAEDVGHLKEVVQQITLAAAATKSAQDNSLMEKVVRAVIGAGQAMTPSAIELNSSIQLNSKEIGRASRSYSVKTADSTALGGGYGVSRP